MIAWRPCATASRMEWYATSRWPSPRGVVVTGERPGGHLVQGRYVQVAVEGYLHGSGYGRRGQHEVIGVASKGGALGDSEAVLFVGDGEREVGYIHVGLDDGMGTDQEVDDAELRLSQDGALLPRRGAGGEDGDGEGRSQAIEARAGHVLCVGPGRRSQGLADGGVVLFGQYLRRREDGGLAPGGRDVDGRRHRDGRFAGADFTLKQPVHGGALVGKVMADLVDAA